MFRSNRYRWFFRSASHAANHLTKLMYFRDQEVRTCGGEAYFQVFSWPVQGKAGVARECGQASMLPLMILDLSKV